MYCEVIIIFAKVILRTGYDILANSCFSSFRIRVIICILQCFTPLLWFLRHEIFCSPENTEKLRFTSSHATPHCSLLSIRKDTFVFQGPLNQFYKKFQTLWLFFKIKIMIKICSVMLSSCCTYCPTTYFTVVHLLLQNINRHAGLKQLQIILFQ